MRGSRFLHRNLTAVLSILPVAICCVSLTYRNAAVSARGPYALSLGHAAVGLQASYGPLIESARNNEPGEIYDNKLVSLVDAGFNWSDLLDLEGDLTEEERRVRSIAHSYAQEKLLPRVIDAYLEEKTDRAICNGPGVTGCNQGDKHG